MPSCIYPDHCNLGLSPLSHTFPTFQMAAARALQLPLCFSPPPLLNSFRSFNNGLVSSSTKYRMKAKEKETKVDVRISLDKNMPDDADILNIAETNNGISFNRKHKPKFQYIFCDMDGTMLNSKSEISLATAKALKEATLRGVKVVIATGKTRPAALNILKKVDLAGKDGIISQSSPGVFTQGLLVYGERGREIFRSNLDPAVCKEALLYSLKQEIPLVAFSEYCCLTLFYHPLVDSLHTIYHEPKAEIIPSVEQLLAAGDIQKMIFLDTTEGVANTLRPYWDEATGDTASVVQAVPDILEIVPFGTSKGNGVRMLLDHLSVTPKEVMAIGDGENDVEMLELAALGIALRNGADKAKSVADVIGLSNDEDGVADAIYQYAF